MLAWAVSIVVKIPAKTAKIAKTKGYVPSRFASSTNGISLDGLTDGSESERSKINAPITTAESADDRSICFLLSPFTVVKTDAESIPLSAV